MPSVTSIVGLVSNIEVKSSSTSITRHLQLTDCRLLKIVKKFVMGVYISYDLIEIFIMYWFLGKTS